MVDKNRPGSRGRGAKAYVTLVFGVSNLFVLMGSVSADVVPSVHQH